VIRTRAVGSLVDLVPTPMMSASIDAEFVLSARKRAIQRSPVCVEKALVCGHITETEE